MTNTRAACDGSWTPGPTRPLLRDGALHVWRADLTMVGDDLCETLDESERARAARISSEPNRQLWPRARGLLRVLLGRYLGASPAELRFTTGAHGKLELPGLWFNLSHSDGLALYAFTRASAVGVDVELPHRRAIDVLAMAARVFGPVEVERLRAVDPAARGQEFRRSWVRYEAELKCAGMGIGGAHTAAAQEPGAHAREMWLVELDMGPVAAAAVATEIPPGELRCWDWPAEARAGAARG